MTRISSGSAWVAMLATAGCQLFVDSRSLRTRDAGTDDETESGAQKDAAGLEDTSRARLEPWPLPAEGNGTPLTPYRVRTCQDLQAMSSDLGATFRMENDVDCTGFLGRDARGFAPVGTSAEPFTGVLDGAGHKIRGLSIDRPDLDRVGLFGVLAGEVRDLGLDVRAVRGGRGVGAMAGSSVSGTIRRCRITGSVSADANVGGIVGDLSQGRIEDSYSLVSIGSTQPGTGLLVGVATEGHIERSYSTGKLAAPARLIGRDEGSRLVQSYFDCDNAGGCGTPGAARTRDDLEKVFVFAYRGWDFEEVWGTRPDEPPCLRWEDSCSEADFSRIEFEGEGTVDEPYRVGDCEHLQGILHNPAGHYALTRDIPCSGFDIGDGLGFLPLGDRSDPFRGSLDGDGHTVTNLSIARPGLDSVGLIGYASGTPTVRPKLRDLGLSGVDIEGREGVGALVGIGEGMDVQASRAGGSVNGHRLVGGLFGVLDLWSNAEDVYAEVALETTTRSTGLVVAEVGRMSTVLRGYSSGFYRSDNTTSEGVGVGHANEGLGGKLISVFCSYEWDGVTCPEGLEMGVFERSTFFEAQGWDFSNVWGVNRDLGFVCLRWEEACN